MLNWSWQFLNLKKTNLIWHIKYADSKESPPHIHRSLYLSVFCFISVTYYEYFIIQTNHSVDNFVRDHTFLLLTSQAHK
jgi:hypothetical protein